MAGERSDAARTGTVATAAQLRTILDHGMSLEPRIDLSGMEEHIAEHRTGPIVSVARTRQRSTTQVRRAEPAIDNLLRRWRAREPVAVTECLQRVLTALPLPYGFPRGSDVSYHPGLEHLVVRLQLPSPSVVPAGRSRRSAARLYRSVVCQITLLSLYTLFRADPSLSVVTLNGCVPGGDDGEQFGHCLITVEVERDTWERISLQRVRPQACLKHLNALLTPRGDLRPVRPLVDFDQHRAATAERLEFVAAHDGGQLTPTKRVVTADRRLGTPASWEGPHWEPFKIALGTFYALCLQRGFDTTADYLREHPMDMRLLIVQPMAQSLHIAVIVELLILVIWASMYFLHNVRLYLRLPPRPERVRVTGYINLTASFALFYFFGAAIGPPRKTQVVIIALIIVVDLLFPLHLSNLAARGARRLWIARDVAQLGIALSILIFVPDRLMASTIWVHILFALLIIQIFLSPLEFKYQSRD